MPPIAERGEVAAREIFAALLDGLQIAGLGLFIKLRNEHTSGASRFLCRRSYLALNRSRGNSAYPALTDLPMARNAITAS
jgi:hypothetical protein